MLKYMTKIKSVIEYLALIDHPRSDEQIIGHTFNGLQDKCKELTAVVQVRDSTITFEDLYDKLLDDEMIQKRGETKKIETLVIAQFNQKCNGYKKKGGLNHIRNFISNNKASQGFFFWSTTISFQPRPTS